MMWLYLRGYTLPEPTLDLKVQTKYMTQLAKQQAAVPQQLCVYVAFHDVVISVWLYLCGYSYPAPAVDLTSETQYMKQLADQQAAAQQQLREQQERLRQQQQQQLQQLQQEQQRILQQSALSQVTLGFFQGQFSPKI